MNMLKQQTAPELFVEECAVGNPGRSCLAGLYLLTDRGTLCRFDAAGYPVPDEELTVALAFRLQAVLHQYRSGAVAGLNLGLVADMESEGRWNTGTFILSDGALNDLVDADRERRAAAESGEPRRAGTVHQGMDELLSRSRPLQPDAPAFVPVLFVPEVDGATLRERYGVDFVLSRDLLEVLDLGAPFAANDQLPAELSTMVRRMHATLRDPGNPRAPEPDAGTPEIGTEAVLEPLHDSCFNAGDAVTGWLLEWFSPFNELTDNQREIIAGYETIRKAPRGTRLIEQGSRDDFCIYLVEGSLVLTGPDGGTMVIKAGTRRSRLPISVLAPHVYSVTAATDVSVIAFSQKLVRRIIEISTTYTSTGSGRDAEASTAAISNGAQALYLNRSYRLTTK